MAVPLVDPKVGIEAVGDGVPRHPPAHPLFEPRDVRLRRARGVDQRRVAGVQMRKMGDLIGAHGAAAAGMVRPAEHAGLEEGAVDNQLSPALEQVEEARLAVGPDELIGLLDRHPRHPPTLGGERVMGAQHRLLFHEELLPGSVPVLLRYDWGNVHGRTPAC